MHACPMYTCVLFLLMPGVADKRPLVRLKKNAQGWLQRALPRQHCCVGDSGHRASTGSFGWHEATELGWKFLQVLVHVDASVIESFCLHLFNRSTGCGGGVAIWPFVPCCILNKNPSCSFLSGWILSGFLERWWSSWCLLFWRLDYQEGVTPLTCCFATTLFMSCPACLQRRESGVQVAHGSSVWF